MGKDSIPMNEEEQAHVVETVRPFAARLAYYRGVI
jgi:hypothetical protein